MRAHIFGPALVAAAAAIAAAGCALKSPPGSAEVQADELPNAAVPAAWKAIGDEDPTLGIPTTYYAAVQLVGMSLYGIDTWTKRADANSWPLRPSTKCRSSRTTATPT